MDKRLRPRYYKNKNKLKSKKTGNVNNKKNKKVRIKVVNKKSKKIQKGGFNLFGKKKGKTSCISCIKYGNCTSNMTGRRIGNNDKLSSKECKHYSKVWKKMKTETGLRQGRDDANLIKAIKLYIKKRPTKTLKGFLNEGILSRKLSSQAILNYIKVKNKYEKRKVSLKIAKLLGY